VALSFAMGVASHSQAIAVQTDPIVVANCVQVKTRAALSLVRIVETGATAMWEHIAAMVAVAAVISGESYGHHLIGFAWQIMGASFQAPMPCESCHHLSWCMAM
jgi:hypothetical protein